MLTASFQHSHHRAPIGARLQADARDWRRFSADAPALDDLVEIRRLRDDKTILRRRADLPSSFPWREAIWRKA